MVTHPDVPGLDISITVGSRPLNEYEKVETGDDSLRTVTRWIISESGAYFGVHLCYNGHFDCGNYGIQESIHLDGELVHVSKVSSEAIKTGRTITHSHGNVKDGPRGLFQFFPIALDLPKHESDYDTDPNADLGVIRVELHRAQEIAPRDRGRNRHSLSLSLDSLDQTVNERAFKGRNLSHRTRLDPQALPSKRRDKRARPSFIPVNSASRPWASYIFRYGSEGVLRLVGALPPSNEDLASRFSRQHEVRRDLERFAKKEERDEVKDFLEMEVDDLVVVGERRVDPQAKRNKTKQQIGKLAYSRQQMQSSDAASGGHDEEIEFLGTTRRGPFGIRGSMEQDDDDGFRDLAMPRDDEAVSNSIQRTRKRRRSPVKSERSSRNRLTRRRLSSSIALDEDGNAHDLFEHSDIWKDYSHPSRSHAESSSSFIKPRSGLGARESVWDHFQLDKQELNGEPSSATIGRKRRKLQSSGPSEKAAHHADSNDGDDISECRTSDRTDGLVSDEEISDTNIGNDDEDHSIILPSDDDHQSSSHGNRDEHNSGDENEPSPTTADQKERDTAARKNKGHSLSSPGAPRSMLDRLRMSFQPVAERSPSQAVTEPSATQKSRRTASDRRAQTTPMKEGNTGSSSRPKNQGVTRIRRKGTNSRFLPHKSRLNRTEFCDATNALPFDLDTNCRVYIPGT